MASRDGAGLEWMDEGGGLPCLSIVKVFGLKGRGGGRGPGVISVDTRKGHGLSARLTTFW